MSELTKQFRRELEEQESSPDLLMDMLVLERAAEALESAEARNEHLEAERKRLLLLYAETLGERDAYRAMAKLRGEMLEAVYLAWNDPGPFPPVHKRAQASLSHHWPTLAKALEALRLPWVKS